MACRVAIEIDLDDNHGNLHLIACAGSLAQVGLDLGSRADWELSDDLTSVPTEQLAFLVSRVTEFFSLNNVSGCDLITVLNNVKSKRLNAKDQSLGSEETQALVQAMESRVETLWLHDKVTLDISILMEYSGQGKCRKVECYRDAARTYRYQLRTWATSRNWTVTKNVNAFNTLLESSTSKEVKIVKFVIERI